jgi:hypothetical protein
VLALRQARRREQCAGISCAEDDNSGGDPHGLHHPSNHNQYFSSWRLFYLTQGKQLDDINRLITSFKTWAAKDKDEDMPRD